MAKDKAQAVVPSVQMPSADLINYRFDQNDKNVKELKDESAKNFEDLNGKLDTLTNTFATKEELKVVDDVHKAEVAAINKRLDNFVWYWRALIIAVFTALSGAVIDFIIGVKK